MNAKSNWPVFATIMSACVIGILSLHSYQNGLQTEAKATARAQESAARSAVHSQTVRFVIKPILASEEIPAQLAAADANPSELPAPQISDELQVPQAASPEASLAEVDGKAFEIDVEQIKVATNLAASMARTALSDGSFVLPRRSLARGMPNEMRGEMPTEINRGMALKEAAGNSIADSSVIAGAASNAKTAVQAVKEPAGDIATETVPAKLASFRKRAVKPAIEPVVEPAAELQKWPMTLGIWSETGASFRAQLSDSLQSVSPRNHVRSISNTVQQTLGNLQNAIDRFKAAGRSQNADAVIEATDQGSDRPKSADSDADGEGNPDDLQYIELQLDGDTDGKLNAALEGFIVDGSAAGNVALVEYVVLIEDQPPFSLLPVFEEYPGEEIVIALDQTPGEELVDEHDALATPDTQVAGSHVNMSQVSGEESLEQQRLFVKYRQRVKSNRGSRREARRDRANAVR